MMLRFMKLGDNFSEEFEIAEMELIDSETIRVIGRSTGARWEK